LAAHARRHRETLAAWQALAEPERAVVRRILAGEKVLEPFWGSHPQFIFGVSPLCAIANTNRVEIRTGQHGKNCYAFLMPSLKPSTIQ
jgi:hypothetical protein